MEKQLNNLTSIIQELACLNRHRRRKKTLFGVTVDVMFIE